MSNGFCKCATGQENLGVVGCPTLLESVAKHIRVSTFDSQGLRNGILLTDLVDGKITDAYLLSKFNEDDYSKRWFPTPLEYKNVEPSRTESVFETMSDGTNFKVDTGVKEFLGIIPKIEGLTAVKMNNSSCGLFGQFEIDTNGSLKGEESADGSILYPVQVAKGSFEAIEIDPVQGSSVQRIQIKFQYAKTVNEGRLRVITSDKIAVSILDINGAIDGELEEKSVATVTSFSVLYGIDSPGAFDEIIPIEGQEDELNWEVIDSALAVHTPLSIIGLPTGQYDFTMPTMAVGDATVRFIGTPASAVDQLFESNTLTFNVPA